jgi:hypothetical protein
MVKILEMSAILSLVVGTTGLIANMLFLDWGRTAMMVFAFFNISGLIDMGVALWLKYRRDEDGNYRGE